MPRNFWIIGNNYNHHICLQVKRENNMERLDMCDAIQTHRVSFILNPLDVWERFPNHLKQIIGRPWKEFKYFVDIDGEGQVNPAIADIPNNCGGIYLFLIKPEIIPDVHLYLAYIGRAHSSEHQNLRKRVREYANETDRLKIVKMKHFWSPHLYVRYLPLPTESNECIDELEEELIQAVLPPFNDRYPKVYNQAIKAAF